MGRKRRAWLTGANGKRTEKGRILPGYYVEWRETGRHRGKHFDRLQSARLYCRSLNERFDRTGSDGIIPTTLESAVVEFVEACGQLAAGTLADMVPILARLVGLLGDNKPVATVSPADIETYLKRVSPPISESTLAKHWRHHRRFFRWAAGRGYCQGDPTASVTVKPRGRVRDIGALPTDKEISNLIWAIDDEQIRLAAMIGLTTGLDRGTVASLSSGNINLEELTISTHRRKTRRSNPGNLIVPIHPSLVPPLRLSLDNTPQGMPLFPAYNFRAWYRSARQIAGKPWTSLTVADFRKIASGRLQRVVPLAQVRAILGHSSVTTTAKHYAPLDPAARQAVDELPLPSFQKPTPTTRRKHA